MIFNVLVVQRAPVIRPPDTPFCTTPSAKDTCSRAQTMKSYRESLHQKTPHSFTGCRMYELTIGAAACLKHLPQGSMNFHLEPDLCGGGPWQALRQRQEL